MLSSVKNGELVVRMLNVKRYFQLNNFINILRTLIHCILVLTKCLNCALTKIRQMQE